MLRKDTIVTHISGNLFSAFISDNWSIGGVPNGGILSMIAVRAASHFTEADPISLTANFIERSIPNAQASISVTKLSRSHYSVSISQSKSIRAFFLIRFGILKKFHGISYSIETAPHPKHVELYYSSRGTTIRNNLCIKADPESTFFKYYGRGGASEAKLEIQCGLRQSEPLDIISLAFFGDCYPPPITALTKGAWIPTYSYSIYFLAKPDPVAEVLIRSETNSCINGLHAISGTLFDSNGNLVAKTSHLSRALSKKSKQKKSKL